MSAPQLLERVVPRDGFTEHWLTGVAEAGGERALFERVARRLAERGALTFQEKLYGPLEARERLLALRAAALEARGLEDVPCTFHSCAPIRSSAALQIWAVVPNEDADLCIETVPAGRGRGRTWRGGSYRLEYLPGIDGLPAGTVSAQAEQMLANAATALEARALSFRDVARTWIYLDRILDWYGEFNRIRTAFFRGQRVGEGGRFPASTGIGGRTAQEACSMDVLAIEGLQAAPLLRSARQEQPFEYGSAFSRALGMELGGRQTIFVSGTASIDPSGASVHRGDPDSQILETLMSIAALLRPQGARLSDVCLATLFCATPELLQGYERVASLLELPALPVVPVVADVCRPELLVEIEAVAVVGRGSVIRG